MKKTAHEAKDIIRLMGIILLGGALALAVCSALVPASHSSALLRRRGHLCWLAERGRHYPTHCGLLCHRRRLRRALGHPAVREPGPAGGDAGVSGVLLAAADHWGTGLSGHRPGTESDGSALRKCLWRDRDGTVLRPAEEEKTQIVCFAFQPLIFPYHMVNFFALKVVTKAARQYSQK